MSVRAKFRCVSVEPSGEGKQVKLEPVTCGSAENDSFFKYTPWGSLVFGTINENASSQFVPGKEYYVDLTPAE